MRDESLVRPNVFRWVGYAYGARLPDRHRAWVLHDLTCRTWVLRHFARVLVQISPSLLFLLLPGPLWVVLMALFGGVFMGLFFSLAYMDYTCEYRLVKHGYPRGTWKATMEAAEAQERADQEERYRQTWRRASETNSDQ